jgi:hypothetical protein
MYAFCEGGSLDAVNVLVVASEAQWLLITLTLLGRGGSAVKDRYMP